MEFEWDGANQRHLARYRVTPVIVGQVASGAPVFLVNDGTGTHMMIGPDGTGELYTVILLDLGDDLWRPITGWRSDGPERAIYREERSRYE